MNADHIRIVKFNDGAERLQVFDDKEGEWVMITALPIQALSEDEARQASAQRSWELP
jgi:hypothetical protein